VWVQIYFCTFRFHPHLTRIESGSGADFVFHPWVHLKPKKKSKREMKKNRNLKKLLEKLKKNLKKYPKPDEKPQKNLKETHLQNPTGTRS
jgi:hypothetical protein